MQEGGTSQDDKTWKINENIGGLKRKRLSLLVDDMIVCTEILKIPTCKSLELMRKFSNLTRYKIKMQKAVARPHTRNEQFENVTLKFIYTRKMISM